MSEVACCPAVDKNKEPDEWEINNWADAIIRAEEIKLDPKKMKLIAPILEKKKKALDGVPMTMARLKQKAYNMPDEDEE